MSSTDYDSLLAEGQREISSAEGPRELENARVVWLGRKGRISTLLRGIPDLPPEERPEAGRRLNQIKEALTALLEEKEQGSSGGPGQAPATDLSHPGRVPFVGRHHPLTVVRRQIEEVFTSLGFDVVEGPDVETEYYNFEALNIPEHHPARGEMDTFFTKVPPGLVLRTHTSPVQIRTMEQGGPPVRIVVPGRVYRSDTPDPTHSPVFHQVEGLYVDEGVGLTDLRGVLDLLAHRLFGEDLATRFRPSYFPFTEPSAELDVECFQCRGSGKACRLCKGTGWIEILGSGMVNPALYGFVDYDPERVTGYAFGIGVDRIAILKYGLDDIRLLLENDLRFLEQF